MIHRIRQQPANSYSENEERHLFGIRAVGVLNKFVYPHSYF